jgi:hypothetical protein
MCAVRGSMATQLEGMGTLVMPDLHALLRPPYTDLLIGLIFFSAAVAETCMGKAWARFYGWTYRAKDPAGFWAIIVTSFIAAMFFIGRFLHSAHRL